jgi:hypothetical protein
MLQDLLDQRRTQPLADPSDTALGGSAASSAFSSATGLKPWMRCAPITTNGTPCPPEALKASQAVRLVSMSYSA